MAPTIDPRTGKPIVAPPAPTPVGSGALTAPPAPSDPAGWVDLATISGTPTAPTFNATAPPADFGQPILGGKTAAAANGGGVDPGLVGARAMVERLALQRASQQLGDRRTRDRNAQPAAPAPGVKRGDGDVNDLRKRRRKGGQDAGHVRVLDGAGEPIRRPDRNGRAPVV